MKMNRFQMLIEAVLSEGYVEDIMPLLRGSKIPDLGGTSTNGWTTKDKYKKGTKLILIQLEADPESLDAAQQDNAIVIIAKYPGGMDQSLLQDKMNDFVSEISPGSKFGISYTTISPGDIANISKEDLKKNRIGELTYKDWRRIAGISEDAAKKSKEVRRSKHNGLGKPASKVHGSTDPELSGTREEITAKIKEKATALAREKMRVLMSNGVSREDALSAAKEAYRKFIRSFHDKSSLGKVNTAPGHVRSDYHPLMSKAGEQIRNSKRDESAAKQAMENARRRALNDGYTRAEAEQKAQEAYNRIMGL